MFSYHCVPQKRDMLSKVFAIIETSSSKFNNRVLTLGFRYNFMYLYEIFNYQNYVLIKVHLFLTNVIWKFRGFFSTYNDNRHVLIASYKEIWEKNKLSHLHEQKKPISDGAIILNHKKDIFFNKHCFPLFTE